MHALTNLSPLDGRYAKDTRELGEAMGELGLFRARARYQIELLKSFAKHPQISLRGFAAEEEESLDKIAVISVEGGEIIKMIETKGRGSHKATNHDVQALILYLREKMEETSLRDVTSWVHFLGTSEDCNNIAYGLMLREGVEMLGNLLTVMMDYLRDMARADALVSMLARTHGQPASPTTFGKEIQNFYQRLNRELKKLFEFKLLVKYNGATGNYNAHVAVYPYVDWIQFSKDFVERFNQHALFLRFEPNLFTTQIEPHDTYAELFGIFNRINIILIDMCQDLWRYISDDWVVQQPDGVGSTAMPNKVNPINIENAEGNLKVSYALMEMFSRELPVSRLQRHLSDSTIIRNFGSAFGYSLIAYKAILRGLAKYSVNEAKMREALDAHPEVLAEAIQNVLRSEGQSGGHELLQKATQGKSLTLGELRSFIQGLHLSEESKARLLVLEPHNYTGLAAELAAI